MAKKGLSAIAVAASSHIDTEDDVNKFRLIQTRIMVELPLNVKDAGHPSC